MNPNRPVILAGNWKMNHGPDASRAFFKTFLPVPKTRARARIYPSYLSLETALSHGTPAGVEIGAQNFHYEKSGAFTGEVSGPMLSEIGIHQVLIGHSERRQYFGETDESVLRRVESALSQGFEVLLCIGETLQERNLGKTEAVLEEQLKRICASEACKGAFGSKLHLAYEPVWAIGTGVTATPEQAQRAHAFIRNFLHTRAGEAAAGSTALLYGGSVTPANFKELLSCPDIDGGLVGGASLKPDSFQALWDLIPG
jgi:triosephosphate isomerase